MSRSNGRRQLRSLRETAHGLVDRVEVTRAGGCSSIHFIAASLSFQPKPIKKVLAGGLAVVSLPIDVADRAGSGPWPFAQASRTCSSVHYGRGLTSAGDEQLPWSWVQVTEEEIRA